MTFQVRYSHACEKCQALYIPYDTDVGCPRCGAMEAGRFDFIPRAVEFMRHNKVWTGRFTPPGWKAIGLAEHILSALFPMFDDYLEQQGHSPFECFIDDWLSERDWRDQDYMRHHLRGIAVRVRDELGIA